MFLDKSTYPNKESSKNEKLNRKKKKSVLFMMLMSTKSYTSKIDFNF